MNLPALILALAFQVVSPPSDTPTSPTFTLQGYVSESDRTVTDAPQFGPETKDDPPVVFVSFIPPLTGTCGLALWGQIDGKTHVAFVQYDDNAVQGKRDFIMAPLPEKQKMLDSAFAEQNFYGIVVVCAIIKGAGASPDTMTSSQFYQEPIGNDT